MTKNNDISVFITDQPDSPLQSQEFITKNLQSQFHRDIQTLISEKMAAYHGRAYTPKNGRVYQIFTLEGKRILLEDPDATEVLHSLFDSDNQLREIHIG